MMKIIEFAYSTGTNYNIFFFNCFQVPRAAPVCVLRVPSGRRIIRRKGTVRERWIRRLTVT